MSSSNRPALPPSVVTDSGDLPAPASNLVRRRANHHLSQETIDAFLEWQVCRSNDDAGSALAGMRFQESFDRLIHSLARRRPGSVLGFEEAKQEAWLVLLSHEPAHRACHVPSEFQARLIKKIRDRLTDLERYHRRRLVEPLDDPDATVLVGREVDPALHYERGRVLAMVEAALAEARDRLSASSFRILILCWIDGHSYAEVEEILGMSIDRVRDRHRRILMHLRALLIRRFGSDSTGPLADYWNAALCDLESEEMMP